MVPNSPICICSCWWERSLGYLESECWHWGEFISLSSLAQWKLNSLLLLLIPIKSIKSNSINLNQSYQHFFWQEWIQIEKGWHRTKMTWAQNQTSLYWCRSILDVIMHYIPNAKHSWISLKKLFMLHVQLSANINRHEAIVWCILFQEY